MGSVYPESLAFMRVLGVLQGRLNRHGGEQKVFWGCNAARGPKRRKVPKALILMGDWCAAAQPNFENQVCDALSDW